MYIFVRFYGFLLIALGILLIVLGLGVTVIGFIPNNAFAGMANNYMMYGSGMRVADTPFAPATFGLMFFVMGVAVAAFGQLLWAIADIATNSRETKKLLSGVWDSRQGRNAPAAGMQHGNLPANNSPQPAQTLQGSAVEPASTAGMKPIYTPRSPQEPDDSSQDFPQP